MAIVNDTDVGGKLTHSNRVYTEGPKALLEILKRDKRLSAGDREIAKRLVRRSAEMMLLYDWTECARAELLADVEYCRPVLGNVFAWKWKAIGAIPPSIGRALRRLRRARRSRGSKSPLSEP